MVQIITNNGGGGGVGLYKYKGSVDYYEDLPTSGLKVGDVYNVVNAFTKDGKDYPAGTNVAWTGTDWDPLGGSIDLSDYQKKLVEGEGIDLDQTTNEISVDTTVIATKQDLTTKQDVISDLDTIRSNASAGKTAKDTIDTYGDIVTHNVSEFATSAQGALADTAVQPGDNVSELVNDAGYLVSSDLKQADWGQADSSKIDYIKNKPTIGNGTLTVSRNGVQINTFSANQTSNSGVDISVPTKTSDIENDSGYIDKTVSNLENYTLSSNLCTVATSGSYTDLSDKPTIGTGVLTIQKNGTNVNTFNANATANVTANITVPTTVAELTDASNYALKSSLCTVATSGKYCDLTGTPTIPTDNCELANGCGYAFDADLCTVAKTGSYADLTDKPTIGTGVLTIQKNGTAVDTFSANATANKCINITVPTDNCELANSCGYAKSSSLATVATSGKYCDLSGTPALCTVATTGSYTDLSNKPTIGSATLTIQKNGTTVNTFGANATSNVTANITVPTCVSELSNDSGYALASSLCTVATSGKYCDLTGTPTIPTVIDNLTSTSTTNALSANQGKALKDMIDDLSALGKFLSLWDSTTGLPISFPQATPYTYSTGDYFLVETIGTTNYKPTGSSYTGTASTTVETDEVEVGDIYIYDGTSWLLQINHGKTVSFANLSGSPEDNSALACALGDKADTSSLCAVATSGKYCDLTGTPTIPTNNNQLTNGCGYITSSALSPYTKTCDLATVATSGSYADLSGTPDLSVYQTTANMVCNLSGADNSHYPTAKAVADALSCAGQGDMLKSVYDPNNKNADAFDYDNFINTPTIPTDNSQLANGCGYITGISCGDVTTALGYTPYNSSNPSGYTTCTGTLTASNISDTAYGSSWNGVTTVAPSKNAVYDKIESVISSIPTNNNQLTNGCGYTACTGTLVASDLTPYAKTCDLAAVATSGKYCDLTGVPSLCTVATSGKYCDLTGTPTIGTATLTIQKNGTTVNTFGANATSNVTANITVPTDTCELSNTAGFITSTDLSSGSGISISGTTISNSGVLSVNGNTGAVTVSEFTPGSGTTGQILTKTATGYAYCDAPATGIQSSNNTYDNVIHLTQAEYDNLGTYDSETLYSTPDGEAGSFVDNTAFGASWDGVVDKAPSMNAVYDVLGDVETLLANL